MSLGFSPCRHGAWNGSADAPLWLAGFTCRDEDGFLYITYSGENTFGACAGVEEVEEF